MRPTRHAKKGNLHLQIQLHQVEGAVVAFAQEEFVGTDVDEADGGLQGEGRGVVGEHVEPYDAGSTSSGDSNGMGEHRSGNSPTASLNCSYEQMDDRNFLGGCIHRPGGVLISAGLLVVEHIGTQQRQRGVIVRSRPVVFAYNKQVPRPHGCKQALSRGMHAHDPLAIVRRSQHCVARVTVERPHGGHIGFGSGSNHGHLPLSLSFNIHFTS